MEKREIVLQPSYMRDFACIGPDCEDSCCVGWEIIIDQATYDTYKKMPKSPLKTLMYQVAKRNRKQPASGFAASIPLKRGDRCPFLSEGDLCNIQLTYGEAYLCNVCASFPRLYNRVDGVLEKSASLACPEAVRLALLNPQKMEFDQIEEPVTERTKVPKSQIDTNVSAQRPERYFWNLRVFTIQMLQDRDYSVDDRIIILGYFYQEIQELIDKGQVVTIPERVGNYTEALNQGIWKKELLKIKPSVGVQFEFLHLLVELLGINNRASPAIACHRDFLRLIGGVDDVPLSLMAGKFQDAFDTYYWPFMSTHAYILENYLVNYVFNKLFPFTRGKHSLYEAYMLLVMQYALIKMCLIGGGTVHSSINTDLVVRLIQSLSKELEHDAKVNPEMLRLLKQVGFTEMAHLQILIRN